MPKRGFSLGARPTVTTSVRVDWDMYQKAKRRGINMSDLMNRALRSVLKIQDPAFGRVEVALDAEAQEAALSITEEIEADHRAVQATLGELQPLWNIYMGSMPEKGPQDREAWVRAKQEKYAELRAISVEEILKELGG
jgi:hypothetical protein